jgi:hypothetical protein
MDAGPVAEETEGVPVGGDELLQQTAAKPSSQLSGDSPTATDAGGLHGHNKASGCLARPIDRDVLLALQEAVLAVSSDGTVVLFNSAAASLWGWQAEEVTGQPVHILLGEGTDLARARHQRLRTKHKVRYQSSHRHGPCCTNYQLVCCWCDCNICARLVAYTDIKYTFAVFVFRAAPVIYATAPLLSNLQPRSMS